jgi:Flp pilus assembly pilin Flp
MAREPAPADHTYMRRFLSWRNEEGQTFAEYSVLLAVITPAIVLAIALLGMGVADNIAAIVDIF